MFEEWTRCIIIHYIYKWLAKQWLTRLNSSCTHRARSRDWTINNHTSSLRSLRDMAGDKWHLCDRTRSVSSWTDLEKWTAVLWAQVALWTLSSSVDIYRRFSMAPPLTCKVHSCMLYYKATEVDQVQKKGKRDLDWDSRTICGSVLESEHSQGFRSRWYLWQQILYFLQLGDIFHHLFQRSKDSFIIIIQALIWIPLTNVLTACK